MRRILLALVAALALAVGVNVAASAAADGGAQATAKKKAGKKKAAKCKTAKKKGKAKGKGKARKALADSAAKKKAKGKKKAKKKSCAKAKHKRSIDQKIIDQLKRRAELREEHKAKARERAKAPKPPPPPPPGASFGVGTYKDGAKSFEVLVLNSGQTVDVRFTVPESNGCPGIPLLGSSKPLTRSATQAQASDSFNVAAAAQVTWTLTVQLPSLSYVLKLDSEFFTPPPSCTTGQSQTIHQGTLVKQ